MLRWIEDFAIDRKLMLIMMLTVFASLAVASLAFVLTDALSTWRSTKEELQTLAGILANNSVGALTFEDAEAAKETLGSLRATESIIGGCLYTQKAHALARYARPGALVRCPVQQEPIRQPHYDRGELVVLHPVEFQGERLGAVYLSSDLSRFYARVATYLFGAVLAVGVSSLIGWAFSTRLKHVITAPILRLAAAVKQVSVSQEYSTRVHGASKDEIGLLMDGFNEMLEQIQLRDAELRRAHDQLERRVEERTAQLEVARDAAQAASRAKSEFLANMSHEIRTPLNAVVGLTDVTLHTDLDETQRDYLTTVRDSADALLAVLNDILDFSKIEAGKLHLERVSFSVLDTVGDALTALATRAEQKGLELACYVDPELPAELLGDTGRLRQVVSNLVSNAIKFTESGEVVVRVEREVADESSLLVRFSVRDTGIGIAPAELDRLFEPFEQADSSTTRRYGGTGLGLSICRQLVELMGGQLGAESTPGEGSTFHFTARFEVPEGIRQRQLSEPLSLAGTRVLIVDDNATNRTILDAVTRAKRMRPVAAASAEEAFALLEQAALSADPIPLMVSDVHMPHTDGFGLAERIRQDERFDDLEIIFLTSAGRHRDRERSERLRIAAHLVKPVKQSVLLRVMARTLEGAASDGGNRVTGSPILEDWSEAGVPPQRILLVEDSLANRKVALALLDGQGHTVVATVNGREALELLADQEFDVVLMDVQMPEMDGFQATAAIRAAEVGTNRHVPIIAMTAHALPGDREKCLAAGMDSYVSKPIRRDDLFDALARATKKRMA